MNDSDSGFLAGESLLLSTRFCNFELIAASSTGHSCVYKAQRMGKWYALKCLKPEYADQKDYRALLQKEFEIGYRLNHPNIARTEGLEDVEELGVCIVMEYVDGLTLKDAIVSQNLTLNQCRHIVLQLCEALTYIHQRQIVHRDLKPENIMLTANGLHVKIIDFGLSDTDDYAILKAPAGTRRYAAPEVVDCLPIDQRADLYSLGVIMQELPFCTGKMKRVACRCTRPDRERRFPSAEAVAEALQKKSRIPTILLAVLLVVVLLLGYTFFIHQKEVLSSQPPAVRHTVEQPVSTGDVQPESIIVTTQPVIHQTTKVKSKEKKLPSEGEFDDEPKLRQLRDFTVKLIQAHISKGEEVSNETLEKINNRAEQLAEGNAAKAFQWKMDMQALVNTMTATYHDEFYKKSGERIGGDSTLDRRLLKELTMFGRETAKREIGSHFPKETNAPYPIIHQLIEQEVARRVGSSSPYYHLYVTAATNAAMAYSREFYAQPETRRRLQAYADSIGQ